MVIFVYHLKTTVMKTIIYTVIPYFSNSTEVNLNDVKSFFSKVAADDYGNSLRCFNDLVESELN